MSRKKNKQIFLEELPRKQNFINWIESARLNCEVYFIYDNTEGIIQIIGYNAKEQLLTIKYNDLIYKIRTSEFVKCRLGILLGMEFTKDFKIEIGTRFKDNKRDLIITDKEYREDENGRKIKWYKYTCNICGWTKGWTREGNLLKNVGCGCCNGKIVVENINSIVATNPWMIKYFVNGYDEAKLYTAQSAKKIFPICPDCGRIKSTKISIFEIYNSGNISCSCSDKISYPNKFAFKMLEELNVEFINEYSPDWIKPKAYDFYFKLNDKEYIIEMDGGLGHGNKVHNKSNKTKEETLEIDNYKDIIANEHGVEVIRVDCDYEHENRFDYIKNNILQNKQLNNLFDLNDIDWKKIEEYSLSNLVKIACNYKKNNTEFTANDIGKIMGYHNTTIIRWLKQGNGVGWCEYNAQKETIECAIRISEFNKKPVEIFKDGISLGIFPSVIDIERHSEELFGVKLLASNISSVCLGRLKHYKKFNFKYM